MKLDWRDWHVVLGAGVVLLLMIGSYFGGRYQSSGARFNPSSPVVNAPVRPLDSAATVRGTSPDSAPAIVTSDEEASFEATNASEAEQVIHNSIAQLRAKQAQVEAEIDQITKLGNETSKEWGLTHKRMGEELPAKEEAVEKEVLRLQQIIDEKLSPNPTFEEYLSIEEWHQLRKLLRENDSVAATWEMEKTYERKMDDIRQKTDKLFEELLAIRGRIKHLALQLEAE